MNKEIWRPAKDYEELYEVSNTGRVRSLCKGNPKKIIPQRIDRGGYNTVRLRKNEKNSTAYVHRLISFAFIQNSENKPFVNHINGDKLDNSIENLEWVTHSENMKHAYEMGLIKIKSKTLLDTCTGKEYVSAKEAAIIFGINYNTLRNYLNGGISNNPTCLKYKFAA